MADAETEIDNDLPDEVISSLEAFYHSMSSVEETLQPLLSMDSESIHEKLNVLDCAKLDLMSVYAMNTMFWVYLVTQGINPGEHGIKHELDRIKNYMAKIREVGDKKKASLKIDKDAARRFVKSALWKSDKDEKDDESPDTGKAETDVQRVSKREKRKKEINSEKRKKHKAD